MTKNITRVVVKPLLNNDSSIINNHFTASNIQRKRNFQRKYGILSQQITKQKLPGKSCEDASREIVQSYLCLNEKLDRATHQGIKFLNNRSESIFKCRHFKKLLLMNLEAHYGCPILLPPESPSNNLMPLHCFYSLAIPLNCLHNSGSVFIPL